MTNIQHINLASVDLNLLVVFDVLMRERSVTRAGEKIGLSQPATSNALNRLRFLFKDDLFVRTSQGMIPTPKAIAIAPFIQEILLQIQSTLAQTISFFPAQSDRSFTLGMSDYTEFVLLPNLMQQLEIIAPHVKILVRSVDREYALKLLDNNEIDLAIGFFPDHFAWHQQQILFTENFVCIYRKNFPNFQENISLANYLKAPHLLVSLKGDAIGQVDKILAQQNLRRQIAIVVPHFLVAPFILAHSNLIATLAERVAQKFTDLLDLHISPLPLSVSGFTVTMLWHTQNDRDPALIWLRQMISQLCIT